MNVRAAICFWSSGPGCGRCKGDIAESTAPTKGTRAFSQPAALRRARARTAALHRRDAVARPEFNPAFQPVHAAKASVSASGVPEGGSVGAAFSRTRSAHLHVLTHVQFTVDALKAFQSVIFFRREKRATVRVHQRALAVRAPPRGRARPVAARACSAKLHHISHT